MAMKTENSLAPNDKHFDAAIVALGYEKRCRWAAETLGISATEKIGIEFGYLRVKSYFHNRQYFEGAGWAIYENSLVSDPNFLARKIVNSVRGTSVCRVFVDISSMSREMMANVVLSIHQAQRQISVELQMAYCPAVFSGSYAPAPIRSAAPIRPELAGWSSRPDLPLGILMGLGCEPGLALGALQFLEPNKAWVYRPQGFDERFERALTKANEHIEDIFDVTKFDYDLADPALTRGKIVALLNSVSPSFRIVSIPFGPKVFSWLILVSVILEHKPSIGIWSFSSKEHAVAVDRDASGRTVWHRLFLQKTG
jgi:hypothetical protein